MTENPDPVNANLPQGRETFFSLRRLSSKLPSLWNRRFPKETETPTDEQKNIRELFFNTFRFGQAAWDDELDIQYELFRWLKTNNYIPPDIPRKIPRYIKRIEIPKQHVYIDPFGRWDQLRIEWRRFYKVSLTDIKPEDVSERDIALMLIKKDLKYQKPEFPRPNRKAEGNPKPDSSSDPHASFVRRYGVMGTTTSSVAFDDLFKRLKPYFQIPSVDSSLDSFLESLRDEWEANHQKPDHQSHELFFPNSESTTV